MLRRLCLIVAWLDDMQSPYYRNDGVTVYWCSRKEVPIPHTPKYLPLFAYGTLRPGCGNYGRLLADHIIDEQDATARGYALYTHGPFPYAVTERGATITGSLLTISQASYAKALSSLDQLEGYRAEDPEHSHYLRLARAVQVPFLGFATELAAAWIYTAGPTVDISTMHLVADGDWLAHRTG